MTDHRPLLVVPKTPNFSRAFDEDLARLRLSQRATVNGIVVLAPRGTAPSALMVACNLWPFVLRPIGVMRVAVVLGVQSYVTAEPLLGACVRCMKAHGLAIAYFHEGHLQTDHVTAWFAGREPRRRVTCDALMKLGERYVDRGDVRGACHAFELATQAAGRLSVPALVTCNEPKLAG